MALKGIPGDTAQAEFRAVRTTAGADPELALDWLEGEPPKTAIGVSWGVPWPRGMRPQGGRVMLRTGNGRIVPTQNWDLAFWPDGSVKWTGLAVAADPDMTGPLRLVSAAGAAPGPAIKVWEEVDGVEVNTGPTTCRISRSGAGVVESLLVDGREVARDGRLIVLREDRSEYDSKHTVREEEYTSKITKLTMEQSGPIRAVVKIDGVHVGKENSRTWLPFVMRIYFTAGLTSVRAVHSFVFDGDPQTDFIRGLGIGFTVPFREERQNRHVRLGGDAGGFWSEPVLMSPGYRTGIVADAMEMNRAQLLGKRIPNLDALGAKEKAQFETIAVWDAFKLRQLGPDSYSIDKRTNAGSSWLHVMYGNRANGYAFLGDVSGGIAVGVKRFWEKHPSALEIAGASTPTGELKIWFWSPDAPAMDLRHYDMIGHDGTISAGDEGAVTPRVRAKQDEQGEHAAIVDLADGRVFGREHGRVAGEE